METFFQDLAYTLIRDAYKDGVAKRSGVPFLHHIDEGLAILHSMNATDQVCAAFCIHPLVQGSIDFKCPVELSLAKEMAIQYTEYANAALCTVYWDSSDATVENQLGHLPLMPFEVWQMLYADKVQNRKDFYKYHLRTHSRSEQLSRYFESWITYLNNIVENFIIKERK